ncbi:MAG: hypothetical protein FJX76_28570 [Armatimonadetes bacterium]|nr:hypothetical protein [Armatimonadota bacterium]
MALVAYAAALAVLGGMFIAGARSATAPFASLAVLVGVILSLSRWFFPTEYRLGADGIEVRFLGSRRHAPWSRFRSWRRERGGFFLSPYSDVARFDRLRGLFIIVDNSTVAENARDGAADAQLTAVLEERIGAPRPAH